MDNNLLKNTIYEFLQNYYTKEPSVNTDSNKEEIVNSKILTENEERDKILFEYQD